MRRCAELLAAAALAVGLATATLPAAAAGVPRLDERQAVADALAAIGRPLPEFALLDRRERPVRLADYRGKPLLVNFIYTGCFTACPTQTRALQDALQALPDTLGPGRFNVVSIGFNQPFDSPQALRAFAAQHRVDAPNWEFLSPHRDQVAALTAAFGFRYVETPAGFDHVAGVTVVDAQGRIRAQVFGDRISAAALEAPLRQALLDTPPEPATLDLAALVERVRVLCTVYDPQTGTYRLDWKLLLEVAGGLGFFLTVGVYLWTERRRARAAHPSTRPTATTPATAR